MREKEGKDSWLMFGCVSRIAVVVMAAMMPASTDATAAAPAAAHGGGGGSTRHFNLESSRLVTFSYDTDTPEGRAFWLEIFRESLPSLEARAAKDQSVDDAPSAAARFRAAYESLLEDESLAADCVTLCRAREGILRSQGFVGQYTNTPSPCHATSHRHRHHHATHRHATSHRHRQHHANTTPRLATPRHARYLP